MFERILYTRFFLYLFSVLLYLFRHYHFIFQASPSPATIMDLKFRKYVFFLWIFTSQSFTPICFASNSGCVTLGHNYLFMAAWPGVATWLVSCWPCHDFYMKAGWQEADTTDPLFFSPSSLHSYSQSTNFFKKQHFKNVCTIKKKNTYIHIYVNSFHWLLSWIHTHNSLFF